MAHRNVVIGIQLPMPLTQCQHDKLIPTPFNDRFAYTCNGCREMGYGSCYQCTNRCDFHLHKECATASSEAKHRFLRKFRFSLQRQGPINTSHFCTACGMSVKGLMTYYHGDKNGTIFLHPCCIKLPFSIKTDGGETLSLNKKLESVPCFCCNRTSLGENIDGWAYVSDDENIACHVKCMKDMLLKNWETNVHQQNQQGQWWLKPYGSRNYGDTLITVVNPSSPGGSGHRQLHYHNAGYNQQNNLLARWQHEAFWILTRATFSLFISSALGDSSSGISNIADGVLGFMW